MTKPSTCPQCGVILVTWTERNQNACDACYADFINDLIGDATAPVTVKNGVTETKIEGESHD